MTACSSASRRTTMSRITASYVDEDFAAIAQQCGLTHRRDVTTFVSKVMVFDKPAA